MKSFTLCIASLVLFCFHSVGSADLQLAPVFGDNMVLQRETDLKIFGWADPGSEVTVELRDQRVSATAGDDGKWLATMQPIQLGEPFSVVVSDPQTRIELKNCLAGEVWICSGQSNMEWTVRRSGNPEEEINNANHPLIRHLNIENRTSVVPLDQCPTSGWQICSPETAGDFTAVGYYFARHLNQELKVPIGLINTTWGGTIVEAWTSGDSLANHPDFAERIKAIREMDPEDQQAQQKRAADQRAYNNAFRDALVDQTDRWEVENLDDANWNQIKAPGNWEGQGYPNVDGVAWYRRTVEIPESWQGKDVTVSLAMIDDRDDTFVNGNPLESTVGHQKRRNYTVKSDMVQSGELKIAVRVTDTGGAGGIYGNGDDLYLQQGEEKISLAGKWKFKLSTKTAALPERPAAPLFSGPNNPTALYNAMVNPLIPVSFKGAIWYQGESNAGRAYQYRSLFPLLIEDWRSKWNRDFPFYWVQLANFTAASNNPGPSEWAELREAQSMTLALPNTGEAVIIDIGEARDIHPKNKQDVGKRLALHALANQYGKEIVCSGPRYKSMTVDGNSIRLTFDHAQGLMAKGGELKRFEIAGPDQKFVWANARIEGQDVVVSAEGIAQPVAVRYAWANNPEGCNLYNAAGLPASPFRTDDWDGVTKPQ